MTRVTYVDPVDGELVDEPIVTWLELLAEAREAREVDDR